MITIIAVIGWLSAAILCWFYLGTGSENGILKKDIYRLEEQLRKCRDEKLHESIAEQTRNYREDRRQDIYVEDDWGIK
jgi:hypothetical protein